MHCAGVLCRAYHRADAAPCACTEQQAARAGDTAREERTLAQRNTLDAIATGNALAARNLKLQALMFLHGTASPNKKAKLDRAIEELAGISDTTAA
jgi:hypothetical protein